MLNKCGFAAILSSSAERSIHLAFLSDRPRNQIPMPIRIGDAFAIGFKRFHGRIDPQIAVSLIGVLPALVPVDRSLYSRIPRPEHFERLRYPGRLQHSMDVG